MVENVRDFGAKGDGVTDDAPAFQRMINAPQLIEQLAEAVSSLLNDEPEESHPLGVEAIAAYRRWRGYG